MFNNIKFYVSRAISLSVCWVLSVIGKIVYRHLPKTWYIQDGDGNWHNVPCIKIAGRVVALVEHGNDNALMCVYRKARVLAIGDALIVIYLLGLITPQIYHEIGHILNGIGGANVRFSEIRADLKAVKLLREEGRSKAWIAKAIHRGNKIMRFILGEWGIPLEEFDWDNDPHPVDNVREWYQIRYLERLK